MTHELFYFGLTQKTTPLAVREKLRCDHAAQVALLGALSTHTTGRMLLPTCERFELYASGLDKHWESLVAFLANWLKMPLGEFTTHAKALSGPEVARHLLRVASGLESRIVGERQILGQIRNAYQTAIEQKTLDAQLSMLARAAIRAGKRVRQETPLDSGRSIVTLAMDWLAESRDEIQGKNVGVLGSGRLAALVVNEVGRRSPGQLTITGRNEDRAVELARKSGAGYTPISTLRQILAQCDLVFACTASPGYLIDANTLDVSRTSPLLLIDLCVPRNVDPSVESMTSIKLAHLDEMVSRMAGSGRLALSAPQLDAIGRAERIVAEELASFSQWRRERRVAPKIAELVGRAAHVGLCKRALHEQITRLKAGVVI